MKRLPITIFFLTLFLFNSFAQTLTREQKIQQANKDVKHFKLNNNDLKKFRHDRSSFRPAPVRPGLRMLSKQRLPDVHDFLKKGIQ